MSCFTAQLDPLATAALDPSKHVNYVLGMILGEDDFRQEFAYLSGRDQWLARDLIGYGTVRGLGVQAQMDGANGPRIYVDAGSALTPSGQLVCVPSPQCANVNQWLAKNKDAVSSALASPPAGPLPVYVLLCYRACPDDNVPIPGEPCRSEDDLVKPSRLRDDFVLELSLKAPEQREERALRDFCEWLRLIDMSDSSATSVALDRFLDEIRHAAAPWYSPPASPPLGDFLFGSPPAWLQVNPADAYRYLRAAFHLWVTELRPKWHARWCGCAPQTGEPAAIEHCVLLAEVRVNLVADPGSGGFLALDGVLPELVQDRRPYLLHLRMLQEWLLSAPLQGGGGGGGGGAGPAPGASVRSETAFGQAAAVGTSAAYAREDHTHGTPPLTGDVGLAGVATRIAQIQGVPVLATGAAAGQMLSFVGGVWRPANLQGEVTGISTATRVSALLNVPIVTPAPVPQADQVLAFQAGPNVWRPAGPFVGRGAPQPYAIVAAGAIQFPLPTGTAAGSLPAGVPAALLSSYNGLVVVGTYDPARGGFKLTFNNIQPAGLYIVKLTPWAPRGSGRTNPFMAYFSDFEPTPAPFGFLVTITVNANPGVAAGQLMIEVSQIG